MGAGDAGTKEVRFNYEAEQAYMPHFATTTSIVKEFDGKSSYEDVGGAGAKGRHHVPNLVYDPPNTVI